MYVSVFFFFMGAIIGMQSFPIGCIADRCGTEGINLIIYRRAYFQKEALAITPYKVLVWIIPHDREGPQPPLLPPKLQIMTRNTDLGKTMEGEG
ncbi:hypothetical protein FKM82_005768 [Ascaphus truei]